MYSPRDVVADFPDFELVDSFTRYMHAPPLPVHKLPAGHWLGWHLWVQLRNRPEPAAPPRSAAPSTVPAERTDAVKVAGQ